LIAVFACLLVALALILSAVQVSIRTRQACKEACSRRQVELLVEAGTRRAVERLRQSLDYQGELWKPTLESDMNALVQIQAKGTDAKGATEHRTVTIIARLESKESTSRSIQRSFTFSILREPLSPSESQ
jgi:hypothetical protein